MENDEGTFQFFFFHSRFLSACPPPPRLPLGFRIVLRPRKRDPSPEGKVTSANDPSQVQESLSGLLLDGGLQHQDGPGNSAQKYTPLSLVHF